VNQTKYSKHLWYVYNAEIQDDISNVNQDSKQNSASCQNAEKPQSIKSIISSINTSLTEAVLNWCLSCFATATRRLFQCTMQWTSGQGNSLRTIFGV